MARVFVSHAGVDGALARGIHGWLIDAGHEAFLDQHDVDGIAVGDEWQQRLHERLRWADAMLCLITRSYTASLWCSAEVGIAQSRGIRLLPVRVDAGVRHPLLDRLQWIDLAADSAAAATRLGAELRRIDDVGGYGWPDDRSPFPGLRPFGVDEHKVFFGRGQETEQLAELLRSPAERADPRALILVGPSGCGKSSLLRAGLLPVIARDDGWLTSGTFFPGREPVDAMSRQLGLRARQLGLPWTTADVSKRLAITDLGEVVDQLLLAAGPRFRRFLVAVDQLEELLTQTGRDERARFVELLNPARHRQVEIVATLRSEFLDTLLECPELAAFPVRAHPVRPLRREALPSVIEGPAGLAAIGIDRELVDRLVADTASGDALPLLAFTLAHLAADVGHGGQLLMSDYERLGAVTGTLSQQADAALLEAVAATGLGRDAVVDELLRLVTVDEQGRPTGRRVQHDELPDRAAACFAPFVDRRLLITDAEHESVLVGVAHDAFLSAWPPMAAAVTAASIALRGRRRIEQAAGEWAETERPPDRLWERGQLAAAIADTHARRRVVWSRRRAGFRRWPRRITTVVSDRVEMSPLAGEFLAAAVRRDRLRRSRSTIVLTTLLVASLLAGGVAVKQQRAAEQGQELATARLLDSQADGLLGRDPRTALQLAVAAQRIHPDLETRSALVKNLLATPYQATLGNGDGQVEAVAFAPVRQTLATVDGQSVTLWDLGAPSGPRRTGQPIPGEYYSVAFTEDARVLLAGEVAGVALWDITDPDQPRRIGELAKASLLAFSPTARVLASGDESAITLFDLTDPRQPVRLGLPLPIDVKPDRLASTIGASAARSAAFSRTGTMLALGTRDGRIALWDLSDRARPRPRGPIFLAHEDDPVVAVSFAPDGRTLASTGEKPTVRLWNIGDPARPRPIGEPLAAHANWLFDLDFAPAAPVLATAGADGTAALWDLSAPDRPRRLNSLAVSGTWVTSLAFGPDGQTLATVGFGPGAGAALWNFPDPAQPQRIGESLPASAGLASAVDFSPSGTTMVTAGNDGARLWDVTDRVRPRPLGETLRNSPTSAYIADAAFAPDGRALVTANGGLLVLWDVADPAHPRRLSELPALDSGWTARGRILAVVDANGRVQLLDTTDPAHPRVLSGSISTQTTALTAALSDVLATTPNGSLLATADISGSVQVWDATDPAQPRALGEPLHRQEGAIGTATAMAFSSDGRTLGVGNDDGVVTLWDVSQASNIRRLGDPVTTHSGGVSALAFTADGSTMLTTGDTNAIQLWDLTDRSAPHPLGNQLVGTTGPLEAAMFTPDGLAVATAGKSGHVDLWDLRGLRALLDHPLEQACVVTGGGLSKDQWPRLIPGLNYRETC